MDPVLIDTSVWIDFFNGKENNQTNIIKDYLENEHPLFICPLIIQEILQGIRDDNDYKEVKSNLFNLDILLLDPVESSIGAADLYRMLRKKGITIKKSNDCMIAFYAIHFGIHLLHNDKDFDLIEENTKLKVM
ncbi:MAG: PIN domain nuclease [Bacteroidota bacterium]|nr:PIN domain nuclease [Bacteroidota bacterium]